MTSPLPFLIFDLDGTLIDSKPGIIDCLRKVLDSRKIGDCGPLERFVGPPAEVWTAELLPDASEEARSQLAQEYRDCYGHEGWMNNSVFAGVPEMLAQLRSRGFPLFVCTSKHKQFAIKILDRFDLSGNFTAIYGDNVEYVSHHKDDLLAMLLLENSISADSAWMIGDRIFDFQAARTNRMRCLAAGWGYGSVEEFALADAIAPTPADVHGMLFRD